MAVQEKEIRGNLPHWPSHQDLREGAPNRIRLGCPVEGENLVRRYIRLFNDLRDVDWTKWELWKQYVDFEWALADLIACSECKVDQDAGMEEHQREDAQGKKYRVWTVKFGACRSFSGRCMFKDLDRGKTRQTGQPYFVMRACRGPRWRKDVLEALHDPASTARRRNKNEGADER